MSETKNYPFSSRLISLLNSNRTSLLGSNGMLGSQRPIFPSSMISLVQPKPKPKYEDDPRIIQASQSLTTINQALKDTELANDYGKEVYRYIINRLILDDNLDILRQLKLDDYWLEKATYYAAKVGRQKILQYLVNQSKEFLSTPLGFGTIDSYAPYFYALYQRLVLLLEQTTDKDEHVQNTIRFRSYLENYLEELLNLRLGHKYGYNMTEALDYLIDNLTPDMKKIHGDLHSYETLLIQELYIIALRHNRPEIIKRLAEKGYDDQPLVSRYKHLLKRQKLNPQNQLYISPEEFKSRYLPKLLAVRQAYDEGHTIYLENRKRQELANQVLGTYLIPDITNLINSYEEGYPMYIQNQGRQKLANQVLSTHLITDLTDIINSYL